MHFSHVLGLVRELWDAGLTHRDIKPANLLVRDGRVLLVDVFFVQVRPRRGARPLTWPTGPSGD